MPVAERHARGCFVRVLPYGLYQRVEITLIPRQAGGPQNPVGLGVIGAVVQRKAVGVLPVR